MTEQELIFDKIKFLKLIASTEAFNSKADLKNEIISNEPHFSKSSLSKIFDKFDLNLVVINQLFQLKLLLKDAEIAVLFQKVDDKSEIIAKSGLSELTKVNNVMHDIKMAISNAKEDISEMENHGSQISLPNKNESAFSEIALSQEIKHHIEQVLNKILSESIDNIMNEVTKIKKEKKSKVLDLSEVSVGPKITPKK